jgi:hypothetical protein
VNAEEMGELLASAAIYDNRTVGDADILAWMRAIGDLPYDDADMAVAAHYGETTDRLMPGHVRARVKAARKDRLDRMVLPAPDADPDSPATYRASFAAMLKRLADGFGGRLAIAGPVREGPPPEAFTAAREALPKPLTKQEIAALQAAESRAERESAGQPGDGGLAE